MNDLITEKKVVQSPIRNYKNVWEVTKGVRVAPYCGRGNSIECAQ